MASKGSDRPSCVPRSDDVRANTVRLRENTVRVRTRNQKVMPNVSLFHDVARIDLDVDVRTGSARPVVAHHRRPHDTRDVERDRERRVARGVGDLEARRRHARLARDVGAARRRRTINRERDVRRCAGKRRGSGCAPGLGHARCVRRTGGHDLSLPKECATARRHDRRVSGTAVEVQGAAGRARARSRVGARVGSLLDRVEGALRCQGS